jgi:hypothetical protein
MPKNTKPTTETAVEKSVKKENSAFKSAIIGVGMLLAVISIAYSTAVIALGTEGITPLVMVAPQAILALGIAIRQFTK